MKKAKQRKSRKRRTRLSERIVDWIYERRRRRGVPICSQQKLERLRALNPEERPEQSARKLAVRKCRMVMATVAAALVLCVVVACSGGKSHLTDTYLLERPDKDSRTEAIGLTMHANDKEYEISVDVDPVMYPEEELDDLIDQAVEEYIELLKGRNVSLDEVRTDLDFIAACSIRGMKAKWTPETNKVLHYDGTVDNSSLKEPVEVSVQLDVTLTERGETRAEKETEVKVRIMPEEVTEEDAFKELAQSAIAEAGKEDGSRLILPDTVDGNPVSYSEHSGGAGAAAVGVLGVLTAVGLAHLPEQRLKEAAEKRDQQMLLDYGEFVSELTVLTGAGLSVRQAWNRMIANKQAEQKNGASKSFLYREMLLTKNALDQGISEEYAYREFGRRCGQPPYLRLGSLLETNIRKGTKGLNDLLRQEADDAFSDRMQLARRQGEKISSKLLIPMMLLFVLILIILMVPAFLSF